MSSVAHEPEAAEVQYELACDAVPYAFVVRAFEATEALNRPYAVTLTIESLEEATDATTLLGRSVTLTVYLPTTARRFTGIVERVVLAGEADSRQCAVVTIVPALRALRHGQDTRIFQGMSAHAILAHVLSEELGVYERTTDLSALDTMLFVPRDFCVQYRESHFLFEGNAALPRVASCAGSIPYVRRGYDSAHEEWIENLEPRVATTPGRVTVRDFDWTRGMPCIGAGHGDARRAHDLYEHGHAQTVTIHEEQELLATFVGDEVSRVVGSVHGIVQGMRYENVTGRAMTTVEKGSQLVQALEGDVVVHAKRRVVLNQDQKSYGVVGAGDDVSGVLIGSDDAVRIEAGSAKIGVNEDGALVLSVGDSKITIAEGRIELAVGGSKILVTPAAVQANKETMPA